MPDPILTKWNDPQWQSWAKVYSVPEYDYAQLYIELKTEQAMHAAWRKRAEEAEAELQKHGK